MRESGHSAFRRHKLLTLADLGLRIKFQVFLERLATDAEYWAQWNSLTYTSSMARNRDSISQLLFNICSPQLHCLINQH